MLHGAVQQQQLPLPGVVGLGHLPLEVVQLHLERRQGHVWELVLVLRHLCRCLPQQGGKVTEALVALELELILEDALEALASTGQALSKSSVAGPGLLDGEVLLQLRLLEAAPADELLPPLHEVHVEPVRLHAAPEGQAARGVLVLAQEVLELQRGAPGQALMAHGHVAVVPKVNPQLLEHGVCFWPLRSASAEVQHTVVLQPALKILLHPLLELLGPAATGGEDTKDLPVHGRVGGIGDHSIGRCGSSRWHGTSVRRSARAQAAGGAAGGLQRR
mmetsp:Transcript_102757/g.307020  ORF Transcript_102757/g.307020 Transcript_102757/m.307020 type:complete len:275 (-) Transcript_102757:87-911(-)